MNKFYLPKSLADSGLGPCFNRDDILYLRFVKDGKIVRVARMDPLKGIVFALYPTDNLNLLEGDAFINVDDNSPRRVLEKSSIKDEIWISLVEGKDMEPVLSRYQFEMLGEYPSGSYKFGMGERSRTFHIIEQEEPS